ncbi:uncharacterized protein BP5553_01106 [Venustampulla echinocandica]|uniref:Uncharacterized protein n=1 Tax=Venustampulla echinocandica TaxID=2656787 RepID=A0A370U043_9HELO|nr:uncharacterized protein BP5553_01106 [Venustampulla echinocandica]RDL41127.1 hypothetical protein BP5553_01106 [Venustampulla echinocandica]
MSRINSVADLQESQHTTAAEPASLRTNSSTLPTTEVNLLGITELSTLEGLVQLLTLFLYMAFKAIQKLLGPAKMGRNQRPNLPLSFNGSVLISSTSTHAREIETVPYLPRVPMMAYFGQETYCQQISRTVGSLLLDMTLASVAFSAVAVAEMG